ncbi:MAG: dienelactone hydrolase family protein [Cryobacterium sp.]|nr:dienelactone hydrolase family protein [Cryobacterium sp.]
MKIDTEAILWSAPERERANRPLLVLMHGYGSHEGDLFSLARYLPLEPVVASVRAPIDLGGGWAWFPPAGHTDASVRLAEIDESTDALLGWLDTLNSRSVGLLGFSQGGAMSLELMRAAPGRFDYAVQLSGFTVPTEQPGDAKLAQLKPPVFWGRGTADEVIPDSLVNHTIDWLPEHSSLTERIYEGVAHSVTTEEIADVHEFIARQY